MFNRETDISHFVTEGGILPIQRAMWSVPQEKEVTELLVTSNISVRDFLFLTSFMGIGKDVNPLHAKEENIAIDKLTIEERDMFFAEQFGYGIISRLASARYEKGGIEAWIGPALVHKSHSLFDVGEESISIRTKDRVRLKKLQKEKPPPYLIAHPDKANSGHYMRITVEDKPMVLAQVCDVLAKASINISELRQPANFIEELDPRTGLNRKVIVRGEPMDIAFLLDQCERGRIDGAISKIGRLSVVKSVDAVLRVIGNPTQDMSRPYSS